MILANEQDYQKIQAELNARKKPSKTLRMMVQALENYRQARKYGWSRAWNKYGVVNFQSFKLNASDNGLRQLTVAVIATHWPDMPEEAKLFIDGLLNGGMEPMGFLFFQDVTEDGKLFESAVVSYGRVNADSRRHRDRLDLILESPVNNGISQGLSRLRIYADPFAADRKGPLWQGIAEQTDTLPAQQLFAYLGETSWTWQQDQNRVWRHWITEYIDYFGPRQWDMQASYFYVDGKPEARLSGLANTPSGKAA